jgi:hypothetical protein
MLFRRIYSSWDQFGGYPLSASKAQYVTEYTGSLVKQAYSIVEDVMVNVYPGFRIFCAQSEQKLQPIKIKPSLLRFVLGITVTVSL